MTGRVHRRGVILDNYDSFTHNLAQAVASLGADVVVHRNDTVSLAQLVAEEPEFLIVSPGPGGPSSLTDSAGTGVVVSALERFRGSIPVLGVCLGMQIIAEQIGGRVRPTGHPMHGKRDRVWHDGTGIFAGLPNPFIAARYHSLAVLETSLPSSAEVRAWTADRTVMGFGILSEATWGVQFHPESFMTPDGEQLLVDFLSGVRCTLAERRSVDLAPEPYERARALT